MYYYIEEGLKKADQVQAGWPYVEIISLTDYLNTYESTRREIQLFDPDDEIRHSKVCIFDQKFYGTLQHPGRMGEAEKKCYFYVDEKRLTFVDDRGWIETCLDQVIEEPSLKIETPAQVFFSVIDSMVDEEGEYLDRIQDELERMEDMLVHERSRADAEFDHRIQGYRRELRLLKQHYKQLMDISSMLSNCPYDILDRNTERLFEYLSNRAGRLLADAVELQDYDNQLHDMVDTGINNKQNQIMMFLTVVTTIFMPLTLLTGWYGMNFTYMPELHARHGYPAVILVAGLLLLAELIFFTRKKWWK